MVRLLLRVVISAILTIAVSAILAAESPVHSARLELVHDKPFVMVTVNGKGPFRFVIDTGTSGQAFVTSELAEQLGLPYAGQERLSDPSDQGKQTVSMVLIQSLQVAGVEFNSVRATVHPMSVGDGSYQGLLGFGLFRDYLLTLDFPGREMTLAAGSLAPDGERAVLPFRMPYGVPIASLHIGGLTIDAQIDSGGFGLSLPDDFATRLKFLSGPSLFANGQSFSTRFAIKAAKLASDVRIGSYVFKRPFVEITSAFPLANFGSSPMQNFSLTFDQKNKLVRLQTAERTLTLAATPMPMHLLNAPSELQSATGLAPVD